MYKKIKIKGTGVLGFADWMRIMALALSWGSHF